VGGDNHSFGYGVREDLVVGGDRHVEEGGKSGKKGMTRAVNNMRFNST